MRAVSQEAVHTMIEVAVRGIKKEVLFPELAPELGGPSTLAFREAHYESVYRVCLGLPEYSECCFESH